MDKEWYIIAFCERLDVYDKPIPAMWFIKDAPFASKQEALRHQLYIAKSTKGTDAEWKEANESAKVVHSSELVKYGLEPFG